MRNAFFHVAALLAALLAASIAACDGSPTDPLDAASGDMRAFLAADPALGVRKSERIELQNPNVALVRITYGKPLDCPSGCFYATALVLQAGGRVGWVTYLEPAPNAGVFRVEPQDTASFTPPVLDEIRRKDASAYLAVAFALACSPNTPDAVRERIRRETPTLAPASFCPKS